MDLIPLDFSDRVVHNLHFRKPTLDAQIPDADLRPCVWSRSLLHYAHFRWFVLNIEKSEQHNDRWHCEFLGCANSGEDRLSLEEFRKLPRKMVKVTRIRVLEESFDEFDEDFFDGTFRRPLASNLLPSKTILGYVIPYIALQGTVDGLRIGGVRGSFGEHVLEVLRKTEIQNLEFRADEISEKLISALDTHVDGGNVSEMEVRGRKWPFVPEDMAIKLITQKQFVALKVDGCRFDLDFVELLLQKWSQPNPDINTGSHIDMTLSFHPDELWETLRAVRLLPGRQSSEDYYAFHPTDPLGVYVEVCSYFDDISVSILFETAEKIKSCLLLG